MRKKCGPKQFDMGGKMCLGSKDKCTARTAGGTYILASAYIGYNVEDPKKNYFMAMVTEVTMRKIFGVLGDTVSADFNTWIDAMPASIADSGIKPFDVSKCTTGADGTVDVGNLNCFAYVSVSPLGANTATTAGGTTISIAEGYSLSGKVDILGYEIAMRAQISATRFFTEVIMDKIDLGLIQIGKTVSGGNVVDGPRFLIDLGRRRTERHRQNSRLKDRSRFQFLEVLGKSRSK